MSEIPSQPSHSDADQTELEKLLRSSKPWFEQNGTVLIYALAAVLAVAAIGIYMNRTPAGDAQASHDWLLASSPEDYGDIADSYGDTTIGVWSRLRQADRLFENATSSLFSNRSAALESRDSAEAAYEQLASRSDLSDEVRERVLIGLARIAETHCDGSEKTVEAAAGAWQQLLNEFGSSLVKDYAEQRLEALKTQQSRDFYMWFAKLNPQPVLGTPGSDRPPVPGIPGLTIPSASDDTAAPADEDQSSPDGEEAGQTPPSGDSPDEDPGTATTGDSDAAETSAGEADVEAANTKPAGDDTPPDETAADSADANSGTSE